MSSPSGSAVIPVSSTGAASSSSQRRPSPPISRRDEDEELVDETVRKEGGGERRPTLEEQRLDVLGGESRELVRQSACPELERRPVRERPATERQPPGLADDGDVARVQ